MTQLPSAIKPADKNPKGQSWIFMRCPKCGKWYYAEKKGDYYCPDCHEPVKFEDELGIKILEIPGVQTKAIGSRDLIGKVGSVVGEQTNININQQITISGKIYERTSITGYRVQSQKIFAILRVAFQ